MYTRNIRRTRNSRNARLPNRAQPRFTSNNGARRPGFSPGFGGNTRQTVTQDQSAALSDLRYQIPLFTTPFRKAKLFYYEPSISLTGTAGVIAQYAFTANGMYDPNITSTGHQPLGFDTIMGWYEQYTVLSSKITVRACGNGIQASCVSVCLAPDTTALALPDVLENGLIVSKVLDGRGTNGTGQRIHNMDLSCDVAKYFGRPSPREIVNDLTLSGTAASNPTEQVYFIINTWGFGGFTDNTATQLDVVIEFDAVFWEPRKVAAQMANHYEFKEFHTITPQTDVRMQGACRTCRS